MSSITNMPFDIKCEILVRLPVECLIRARAVSKGWRDMIDDPCFVREHTNNNKQQFSSSSNIIIQTLNSSSIVGSCYSLDLEALKSLSSTRHEAIAATPLDNPHGLSLTAVAECNGLVLTVKYPPEEALLTIWNPSTHERLDLPDFPMYRLSSEAFGLGYDSTTDDYKVVVILRNLHTHVYSLKSDSWRRIINCPAKCDHGDRWWGPEQGPGVFACGGLNWLSESREGGYYDDKIVALDLQGTEKYTLLQVPHDLELQPYVTLLLNVFGGCLALCDSFEYVYLDVWVMKDYGDDDSWIKLFSIDYSSEGNIYRWKCLLRPVAFIIKEKLVFLQDSNGTFFLFDVETKSFERVGIHEEDSHLYAKQMFVGNIFRLHANCGGGVRKLAASSCTKKKKASAYIELVFCIRDANGENNVSCSKRGSRLSASENEELEEDYFSLEGGNGWLYQ